MKSLRLIWTSDATSTQREECPGEVIGMLIGFESFTGVSDEFEAELVALLKRYSQ